MQVTRMVCNAFKFERTILKKTASKGKKLGFGYIRIPVFPPGPSLGLQVVCGIFKFCKHSTTDSNFVYWTSFDSDVFSGYSSISKSASRLWRSFKFAHLWTCCTPSAGVSVPESNLNTRAIQTVWTRRCSRPGYQVLPAFYCQRVELESLRLLLVRTTRKTSSH